MSYKSPKYVSIQGRGGTRKRICHGRKSLEVSSGRGQRGSQCRPQTCSTSSSGLFLTLFSPLNLQTIDTLYPENIPARKGRVEAGSTAHFSSPQGAMLSQLKREVTQRGLVVIDKIAILSAIVGSTSDVTELQKVGTALQKLEVRPGERFFFRRRAEWPRLALYIVTNPCTSFCLFSDVFVRILIVKFTWNDDRRIWQKCKATKQKIP